MRGERFQIDLVDINTIESNRTGIRLVKSQQQTQDRTLATTAWPHKRDKRTAWNPEINVVESDVATVISKCHVIEFNCSRELAHTGRARFVEHFRLFIQEILDPLQAAD